MGTNYYIIRDKLKEDEIPESGLHIGKQSCGWVFHFQAYPGLKLESYDDWKQYLKKGYIYDEYRQLISYNDMMRIIDDSKNPHEDGKIPYDYYNVPDERDIYFDRFSYSNRGFDFTIIDFS